MDRHYHNKIFIVAMFVIYGSSYCFARKDSSSRVIGKQLRKVDRL